MNIISFFSGCGGLDLGFECAGFNIIWANEFDKTVCPTYTYNHPNVLLNTKDIREINSSDLPDCDGFIGGPPCQAWSEGGLGLGLADDRGKVFLDYIRLIKEKKPKFFLIENVPGILSEKHNQVFSEFINQLSVAGYNVSYQLLNAKFFNVPQDRERVFIVGIRSDFSEKYKFPQPKLTTHLSLKSAIGDIYSSPFSYNNELVVQNEGVLFNHDVYTGAYDRKYMARNRVRTWSEVSFTIQAQAKNIPIHPQAPKMQYVSSEKRVFVKGSEHLYRRLSVRECARIQTFPDSFRFLYSDVKVGYKMVGNAVPPKLAYALAVSIKKTFRKNILIGYYKGNRHLNAIQKNSLYYFPMSHDLSLDEEISYVVLHHGSIIHVFVASSFLTQKSKEELICKGFSPRGDVYYTVSLGNELVNKEKDNILKYCVQSMNSFKPILLSIDM